MTHFRILQLERPGIPCRPGGLGRYMHDSFENEITFWCMCWPTQSDSFNTQNNEKCQIGTSRLCKPLQPNDPLGIPQAFCGECFSSHSMALNVWDDDSFSRHRDGTWYRTLNNWQRNQQLHPQHQTGSSFPNSSNQPQFLRPQWTSPETWTPLYRFQNQRAKITEYEKVQFE